MAPAFPGSGEKPKTQKWKKRRSGVARLAAVSTGSQLGGGARAARLANENMVTVRGLKHSQSLCLVGLSTVENYFIGYCGKRVPLIKKKKNQSKVKTKYFFDVCLR